ncbi:MAG: hypothetical protein AAGC68_09915, partial [Verrucomicrobiota bacterium]
MKLPVFLLLLAGLILHSTHGETNPAQKTSSASKPQWIWAGKASAKEVIFARRQWTQRGKAKSAILDIAVDNGYTLFLNGKKIGSGDRWEAADRYDLTAKLANGDNVLAIEARNAGGAAGLVARLRIQNQDGTTETIVTGPDWLVSKTKLDGWQGPSVAESGWSAPVSQGILGDQPWGNPLANPKKGKPQQASAPVEIVAKAEARVEGFEVEKLYDVPKETQGSWVSMAVDEEGRLYCADQDDKGLFRISIEGEDVKVEKMPAEVTGAQGLLWHRGVLYAGINGGTPA